ncbi:MAG: hypothetical protein C0594_16910 [Marinilabiliales bacterium]|nr:MAG: hypothetical protein C0594_16910 [Marinilabiliales bacterium]
MKLLQTSIVLILICLIYIKPGCAQPIDDMGKAKYWELKGFAKNAIMMGDIYSAIDYYEEMHERKPSKSKVTWELAELHRTSRNYERARDLYKEVYDGNKSKYVKGLYYYALMLKMTGQVNESTEYFQKFKKKYKTGKDARKFKKLVYSNIDGNEMYKEWIDSARDVLINHLDTSINYAHIEFSPIPLDAKSFSYGSYRTNKLEYYDPNDSAYQHKTRKFYKAKLEDDQWRYSGEWNELPVNSDDYNIGGGAFSPDGKRFYFTKLEKNWKNETISKLYVTKLVDGEWLEPEKLPEPINHPQYTTTQPAVGTEAKRNKEILYFVSDRPGTRGGMDIWYSVYNKRKGGFVKIKNLGGKINTVGDEFSPYFDMNLRRLYFSSDGLPGLGGLDIFYSTGERSSWSKPKNMGYPFNSNVDDLHLVPGKNREIGFFISNREGGNSLRHKTCCDDIYSYKWKKYININVVGNVFELVKKSYNQNDTIPTDTTGFVEIVNDSTAIFREKLDKIRVKLFLLDDESTDSYYITSTSTNCNEQYNLELEQGNNYKLMAEKDGYFSDVARITTKGIKESTTLVQDFTIEKIPKKAIVIDNIYYPFDKSYLTEEAKATIDTTIFFLLENNPELIVEISSHTDSKGNDEYNQKLSQKRAESVVQYLIEKGIEEERLLAKGYGETQPIANNTNPDGSDNEEGRAKNRRTEFKVIGSADQFSILNRGDLQIESPSENKQIKSFGTEIDKGE